MAAELNVVHLALPTSRGATGARGSVTAAIAGSMPRANTEGKHREQNGEPDGQKNRPPRGTKKACPASAFRRNVCRPTGPGPRAAAVAIWPRCPQNRFRHAAAYCKQTAGS
jgi:hypothetical protein